MRATFLYRIVVVSLMSLLSLAVHAASYSVVDLGPQGGAGAFAVNDHGWVVFGNRVLAPGAGGYTVVAELMSTKGDANDLVLVDINNHNAVAGNDASTGYRQAFVWQSGFRTNLLQVADYSGRPSSIAAGINDAGLVAGNAGDYAHLWTPADGYTSAAPVGVQIGAVLGSGDVRGVSGTGNALLAQVYPYYRTGYLNGVVDGTSGPPPTVAPIVPGYTPVGYAINAADVVAGAAPYDCGGFTCLHPFVWDAGGVTLLPVATDPASATWPVTGQARSINDAGFVVGSTYFAAYDARANLWQETVGGWEQTDLNTLLPSGSPFWKLTDAYDINNRGQIVGLGWASSDPTFAHVFLLTPVPVPAAWSLMLAGGLVLGSRRLRA